MEMLKKFDPLFLFLLIVGALNWGVLGVTGGETNVLSEIFGTGTFTDVIYVIVGVAALLMLPRLFEDVRVSTHRTRPTGA